MFFLGNVAALLFNLVVVILFLNCRGCSRAGRVRWLLLKGVAALLSNLVVRFSGEFWTEE